MLLSILQADICKNFSYEVQFFFVSKISNTMQKFSHVILFVHYAQVALSLWSWATMFSVYYCTKVSKHLQSCISIFNLFSKVFKRCSSSESWSLGSTFMRGWFGDKCLNSTWFTKCSETENFLKQIEHAYGFFNLLLMMLPHSLTFRNLLRG